MERVLVLAEIRRHVRRGEQAALEIVGPIVIRALNPLDEVPFGLLAQPRAAMPADVEQRVNRPGRVARDDHAVVAERPGEIVARVRYLIGAPRADPAIEVEALELGAIEVGIGIESPRQGRMHAHRR